MAQSPSNQSKYKLHARIDSSKTGYHYGKQIPELRHLYDYVKRCYAKTHEIYVLLISIGKKDYIGGFHLVKKSGKQKTNVIAQNLLQSFEKILPKSLRPQWKSHVRISLDGAWGKGKMIEWLHGNQYHKIAIKSGGVDRVEMDGLEMRLIEVKKSLIDLSSESDWLSFHPCHNLDGITNQLEKWQLVSSGLFIWILTLRFHSSKSGSKPRYLTLLSLDIDRWYAYQVVQTYKGRWSIETMFRTCKQYCDLEKISFWDAKKEKKRSTNEAIDRIELMLSLRFISYMVINWYRVAHTRWSRTGLQDVIHRWELYFDGLSAKAFQELFSGT